MKTEMTLEFYGTPEDAEGILRALAKSGVVLHQARIQGAPIDVGPLLQLVPEPEDETNPLEGVDFASDEAAQAAISAGLTAEDFDLIDPSGKGGYTVADVRGLEGLLQEDEVEEPEEPAPVGV